MSDNVPKPALTISPVDLDKVRQVEEAYVNPNKQNNYDDLFTMALDGDTASKLIIYTLKNVGVIFIFF